MKRRTTAVRLLLVDDHALFREGMVRLLEAEPAFTVIGNCDSIDKAVALIQSREVDVVLLDWDLGAEKGAQFLNKANEFGFTGKILIVTAGVGDREAADLVTQSKIAGILLKHRSPEVLVQSIWDVMEGKTCFEPDFLRRALETASTQSRQQRNLTDRERRVLSFLFEGLANKEIGDRLGISESSVKASLQQLFSKTGVRTRSQLVRIALEQYRDQL